LGALGIYGAGGFGREILDRVREIQQVKDDYSEIYFIDDTMSPGAWVENIQVLDFINAKEVLRGKDCKVLVGMGDAHLRSIVSKRLLENEFKLGTLICQSAIISESATIEDGVIISPWVLVSHNARIGFNTAVNIQSIIGHDVTIGKNCSISSMVNLGGGSTIGESVYIGMGALIKEKIIIGDNSIIAMGAVVYNDIPSNVIAVGNPARVSRRNDSTSVFEKVKRD
jgi:sugar O-acyltransferase (sialic acid O-acetyltransferase NeuD family)